MKQNLKVIINLQKVKKMIETSNEIKTKIEYDEIIKQIDDKINELKQTNITSENRSSPAWIIFQFKELKKSLLRGK